MPTIEPHPWGRQVNLAVGPRDTDDLLGEKAPCPHLDHRLELTPAVMLGWSCVAFGCEAERACRTNGSSLPLAWESAPQGQAAEPLLMLEEG